MAKVLVVDDDSKICLFFSKLIEQMGHDCTVAGSAAGARQRFEAGRFDLVLLDLELPDGNGLDLLPEFAGHRSSPEVIIITGTGDVRGAELAFKYGAWDYVQKPFLFEEVSLPITRALQYRRERLETARSVPLARTRIIGESQAIMKCLEDVGKAAATDVSVLITGETGTGKELFARAVHENSKRAGKPFIAVDCASLPETLLESTLFGHEKGAFTGAGKHQDGLLVQANGGTLMLDEIGDLPLSAQKTFLRALQERRVRPVGSAREIPVDIRLVAATNLDLQAMIKAGQFRQDLLFRIRAIEIKLPPLRERSEDIEEIIVKKLHEFSNKYGMETKAISSEFVKVMSRQHWPGNIRELINVLEYVLVSSGQDPKIFPKHLPPEYRISDLAFDPGPERPLPALSGITQARDGLPTLSRFRQRLEKEYLKALIIESKGDRKAACRISKISQSRLYELLNKHGLPGFQKTGKI
ncbi:MAG: sigma-54 dependent transcriptional regulator [Desulfobacterales bacterium]|nr:sigma-54 dependent transcriptional regulator [Desulfobacterales bacterium]